MARVLGVFSHPDDETFWAGAALATHAINGYRVDVYVLSEGFTSTPQSRCSRYPAFYDACGALGVHGHQLDVFPDQQSDAVRQLEINRAVEVIIERHRPSRVYTHFVGDLNHDHRRVAEAVLVATRGVCPVWMVRPEELGRALWPFKPDHRRSVLVEPMRAQKLAAVQCYPTELRASGVRSLAYFQAEEREDFEVRK